MKKIGVSGCGAAFLFVSLVAMEVDPVKIQPGEIGNKSANLVFLRDNLVQLRPSLQEQGYDVAVPDFVPVTTDEAQQFLRAQHLNIEARWRAVEKRRRDQITQEDVPADCKEVCAPEGDQELCKRLCLPGGKFEKLSGVIKNPDAQRKHEYRPRQRPFKKSSAVLGGPESSRMKCNTPLGILGKILNKDLKGCCYEKFYTIEFRRKREIVHS